jgi:CheY-like chemotaxis protein
MTYSRNDAGVHGAPSGLPAPSAGPSTKRILVVDDNEDAADLLREILACLGHDVQVANDGLTALKLAESFHPDIALLDIGMPGMNGRELAARLREHRGGASQLRLIAVTGYAAEVLSPDDGFETHLVKPFDLTRLQQLIARSV